MSGHDAERSSHGIDFDAFYRTRWDQLRQVFAGATFYGIDPDDIAQETMVRAEEQLRASKPPGGGFSSEDALFGWCVVVGGRLIARQRLRRRESPGLAGLEGVPDYHSAGPEELVIAIAEVARVLEKLPERHLRPLVLGAAGHTASEIAQILKVTPDAAEKRLQRARKAAKEGWTRVVVFLASGIAITRRLMRSASTQTQALFASAMTISLVASLVLPAPFAGVRFAPPRTLDAAPTSALSVGHVPIAPLTLPPTMATNSPQKLPAGARQRRRPLPTTTFGVPVVPRACTPHICVTSDCPDSARVNGDRLHVKGSDGCRNDVTESVIPVCESVPDNPVVGCQRQGDPQWQVDPPPTISPPKKEGPL